MIKRNSTSKEGKKTVVMLFVHIDRYPNRGYVYRDSTTSPLLRTYILLSSTLYMFYPTTK